MEMNEPNGASSAAPQQTDQSVAFDIATTEIASFTQLLHFRSGVFTRRKELESFRNRVNDLATDGEMGRRRGLGHWMLAEYEEADQLLAKHPDDDVAAFTRGQAKMSLCDPSGAAEIFSKLVQAYPEAAPPLGGMIEAKLEARLAKNEDIEGLEELEKALESAPESFKQSAEYHYLCGRAAELNRDPQGAIDAYETAHQISPTNRTILFRFAHLSERCGLDEEAIKLYEELARVLPIDSTTLMNMGVLYEDLGRDQDAAACFDVIVDMYPTDTRARLYLEDARQGMTMYYDEDMERKEDRLNQILRIPITDFELSVRARNCLNKMQITTLGDLVQRTEQELLSYKNFGETSLTEIKEILHSKGLRLGMPREEAVASIEAHANRTTSSDRSNVTNKPILDLQLSIRARRTVETLGCLTVGDITKHSAEELLGMPNFGQTSLQELRNKLQELGLKLKGD